MIFEDILSILADVPFENTYLYLIIRSLKSGITARSKVLEKYDFSIRQIDIDDSIREHLHSLTFDVINNYYERPPEIHDYDLISDDSQKVFTYSMKNSAISFADVIDNQLKAKVPKVFDFKKIVAEEKLWAYCVGFYHEVNEKWIYTFRKILPGKIAVDEGDNVRQSLKSLRTIFNTKSNKLELVEGETMQLDKQIDCIFFNETFYVFRKTPFEQIVGLDAEYEAQAIALVKDLGKLALIEGLDMIVDAVTTDPTIHKKLVRVQRMGNYKELSTKNFTKMKQIGKEFGFEVKIRDGKMLIENEEDIETVLKLLCEYFKKGRVFGEDFGTYAGKKLSPLNN